MAKNNNIVIYSKDYCPYCFVAKRLLKSKGLAFTELNVGKDAKLKEECFAKSNGKKSVPQIFINDIHIGGCDDLYAANSSGKLAEILGE